jgi:hypothetical protein
MRISNTVMWAVVALSLGSDAKLFGKDKREYYPLSPFVYHFMRYISMTVLIEADPAPRSPFSYHVPLFGTKSQPLNPIHAATVLQRPSAVYEDWSLEQSVQFLKEQGVVVKDSLNLASVQQQVADNADAAATVSRH